MTSTELTGRVVTPDGVIDGIVRIEGERIASVTPDPNGATGPWIVPGFVDIHVHGGGGYTFTTGDAESARGAAAYHLTRGTTTMLASLVSSPYEVMLAATEAYAPLVGDGVIAGVHFEGPYLSEACCGAQNPAYLRDPDPAELESLLKAGAGVLRMVTIAPERSGALDAIARLAGAGVVAAVGHTDATYEQVKAAVEAGATVGTHVFNGMRPPHHRTPGPVYALLGSAGVVCEFVADGVHLADGTLEFAAGVTGPGRAVLITDAIDATGMADGDYELGGQPVTVSDGVARLASGPSAGAIAGSTLTMDAAFRRAARVTSSIEAASRMASGTPASVLGLSGELGSITPGLRADLVVLDQALTVTHVYRDGALRRS